MSRSSLQPAIATSRRAANVTLPEPLLREARDMGINLSQACERGLVAAVTEQRNILSRVEAELFVASA